ncbi:MAG TPA: GNAT family N-acetyltransferase [Kofleriaceae bacterium]|nr:GNAT family N-acetyltransferase [Kofleriaceae bacterium]
MTDAASFRLPPPTARLAFRCWSPGDLPLARRLFGDPRVTALVGGPFDDAAVAARLEVELSNQRDHGISYWPIALHGGPEIGCCGLKPRDPPRRVYEFGFYLLPPWWGQGLATEAGAAVIAHAFDALGAPALFAGHHPENAGSRRALEKLGFRYTHHELYPPTGLDHPCYELGSEKDSGAAALTAAPDK